MAWSPRRSKSAYVAAKHGLVGLTKVIALETAEDGITCNAICPGYALTPLVEKQIDEQAASHGIPRQTVIRDIMLAAQPNKAFIGIGHIADLGGLPLRRRRIRPDGPPPCPSMGAGPRVRRHPTRRIRTGGPKQNPPAAARGRFDSGYRLTTAPAGIIHA